MYILLVLPVIIAVYLIYIYNQFVSLRAQIKAAIQEIGNQLKRQADLIPNLIGAVKGYLKHETAIFDKLTEARKNALAAVEEGNAQKMSEASAKINQVFTPFKAILESNPEIKGSDIVKELTMNLSDTADKVMYSRRLLINLALQYNTLLSTIPSKFIGQMFGFKEEAGLKTPEGQSDWLEVSSTETTTPKVDL